MARTFSIASQVYPAGTHGPFSIDSFTAATTSGLRWTLTVEGWPTNPAQALARITVKWGNGAGLISTINGSPRNSDGTAATIITGDIGHLLVADGNGDPIRASSTGATILVEVFVPIRTAATLTALA